MTEPAPPHPPTAEPTRSPGRAAAALALLVLGGAFVILGAFAVWVDRVALDTEVFLDTSSELIADDEIREAVALRAVDELYSSVDVKQLIEEQAPENLDSLAGVAAAGARQALYQILDRALRQPALQRLWTFSLRQSHRTLVLVLREETDVVTTDEGVAYLDLRPLVLEAAERIGIRDQVEERLPAAAGRVEVLSSDELDTAQDATRLLETLAWILPLLALGTLGGALWAAPDRRRGIRGIGVTLAAAGVLGLVAVSLVGSYVVDGLADDPETREAARNAWDIVTELLRSSFVWLVPVGALFVLASVLAGPGRRALGARGVLAPALRERAWPYAALAVVALVLLLTGPVADFARFLVVAVLVALGVVWIELTRARTRAEFPDARGTELVAELRARVSPWLASLRSEVDARRRPGAPAATAPDLTERLATLAELHARGELTDEEYAAAKARVLAGG